MSKEKDNKANKLQMLKSGTILSGLAFVITILSGGIGFAAIIGLLCFGAGVALEYEMPGFANLLTKAIQIPTVIVKKTFGITKDLVKGVTNFVSKSIVLFKHKDHAIDLSAKTSESAASKKLKKSVEKSAEISLTTSILLGLSLMIMTILSGGAIAPALVATLSIGMATFCSCLTALVGKQTFDMAKQKIAEIKKSPGQQEQQIQAQKNIEINKQLEKEPKQAEAKTQAPLPWDSSPAEILCTAQPQSKKEASKEQNTDLGRAKQQSSDALQTTNSTNIDMRQNSVLKDAPKNNKNLELSALKAGLDLAKSGFCSFAEHKSDKGINHNNNNQEVGSKSQSISDLIKEGKMSAKFSESCVSNLSNLKDLKDLQNPQHTPKNLAVRSCAAAL